jgi:hypothetical protein
MRLPAMVTTAATTKETIKATITAIMPAAPRPVE